MIAHKDVPLLLASGAAKTGEERFALDRVRMQKAAFLLVMRGSDDWKSLYRYEPYRWGPYSGQLMDDIRMLRDSGDLKVEPKQGARYGSFVATPSGDAKAARTWQQLTTGQQGFIRSVRAYVCSRSFSDLLTEIYAAYPDYATESEFRG